MKLWIALMLLAASAAQAQTVWRCGPDGRNYSDAPCRDGRAVEVAQARPAADLSSAQEMAQREKALVAKLVRERQHREAVTTTGLSGIRDAGAANAAAVKPKVKARSKGKHRPEDADTWRAVAPPSRHGRG